MNFEEAVAKALLEIKAVKLNTKEPFQWASGILSPIYCDNRLVLSYPEKRSLIINGFIELIKKDEIDLIAGVATAGIPHGALIAQKMNLPFIYIRSKPKGHGMQNLIEGKITQNARVLMIEDLISTGGSAIQAAKAVQDAGMQVVNTLAIFSYNFEVAKNNFNSVNLNFKTITDYNQLLKIALSENYISNSEIELLKKWRLDPKGWLSNK